MRLDVALAAAPAAAERRDLIESNHFTAAVQHCASLASRNRSAVRFMSRCFAVQRRRAWTGPTKPPRATFAEARK